MSIKSHKRIVWTSWNALAEDYIEAYHNELEKMEEELNNIDQTEMTSAPLGLFMGGMEKMNMLHTPFGMFPMESMFKPSDMWDCRIGVTNFSITNDIKDILANDIEGIEALKVMGRYTFCIGIPVTFDFKDVRVDIENKICTYTETEVMTEETQATVELVKEQLKHNKYWSILVASTGKVDYIVSDKLDHKYLEGLNKLVELKQSIGGIILRGDDG
jgi:hypothetical protein|tara:strand:- start:2533 stop:3180 length:648 start_codon:yes stop_codon:yes gene_type:complete